MIGDVIWCWSKDIELIMGQLSKHLRRRRYLLRFPWIPSGTWKKSKYLQWPFLMNTFRGVIIGTYWKVKNILHVSNYSFCSTTLPGVQMMSEWSPHENDPCLISLTRISRSPLWPQGPWRSWTVDLYLPPFFNIWKPVIRSGRVICFMVRRMPWLKWWRHNWIKHHGI